jgi:hypothetical protein
LRKTSANTDVVFVEIVNMRAEDAQHIEDGFGALAIAVAARLSERPA